MKLIDSHYNNLILGEIEKKNVPDAVRQQNLLFLHVPTKKDGGHFQTTDNYLQ